MESLLPLQNTDAEKLELISFIGKMYTEYVTGQYSSNDLEQMVIQISEKIDFVSSGKPEQDHVLIVMSIAGSIGGHTALVHNWIKWDDENQYSVAFTNMDRERVPDFIKEAVQSSGGEIFHLSGDVIEKAKELMKVSQKFERIILFTHMEDIIPILAYGHMHWKVPVYLYNHADFRFSYGFSVADIVLNLCEFDRNKTIRYRGISEKDSVYLPFPGSGRFERHRVQIGRDNIRKMLELKYGVKENEKLIVSMGQDFKYENILGYEFDTFINDLLSRSKAVCSFLIIGADKDREKWIRLQEKTQGKARALGMLPRSEAEQIISAADLYIVSFPMMASGIVDAERAKVPSLVLDIVGSYFDQDDIRAAGSVEELLEKSLEVLDGKGDKYLRRRTSNEWTKQEWKCRWREIYDSVDHHTIHTFYPQRHIEKQEYVNCQLMQKQAAQTVYSYIMSCHLKDHVLEEIYLIDQVYDMGISYHHLNFLNKKCDKYMRLSEKHLQLYMISLKWLEVKRKGIKIDEYLYGHGHRTAAIYGMSFMGESLAVELKGGLIKVAYGIDRNADQLRSALPVFKPSDKLEKVDIIINTTIIDNSKLLEAMGADNTEMLQFSELLDVLIE